MDRPAHGRSRDRPRPDGAGAGRARLRPGHVRRRPAGDLRQGDRGGRGRRRRGRRCAGETGLWSQRGACDDAPGLEHAHAAEGLFMVTATSTVRAGEAPAARPAEPILVVDDVSKRFETPDGILVAVDHVSFDVAPGEFLAVIGPSGCGKSTLFNVIGGLIDSYEGRITVAGQNVAFPLEITGVARAQRREQARHFINLVGLDGFENRYPAELSGGMRQRVSMARTLASVPKIMLMDEPFAALDEQTRLLLGDKVLQIQQDLKQTTLLITHNITEAVQLADRILVMTYRPGKLKRMVEIKLPRPRSSEIVSSET